MPIKCQAVNCRSGYNPTDAEKAELNAGRIPECRAHSLKKFPEDPELRNKWIIALHRDPKKINIKSGGVCTKHFLKSDFLSGVTKRGEDRKNKTLKKGAIPTLFQFPLSIQPITQPSPVEENFTLTTHQIKQEYDSTRIRDKIDEFFEMDKIVSLDDLYQKLQQKKLPTGYTHHWYTDPNNSLSKVLAFQHMVLGKDYNPLVTHVLIVKPNLSFKLFVDGTSVGQAQVRHLVTNKFHTVSEVLSVMSVLSTVKVTAKNNS